MPTASTDDLVGELLDGRYRVIERLADGGMATVYLAVDTRLDREVALKVMRSHLAQDATFRSRFHREARSAARLSHPGVVAVFDQGEDEGRMFLAMEYVPGQTLREVIDTEGALTPRAAIDIMVPVLDALAAAHRAGIIHRDVKPENVILREDGAVKVADFGLARAVTSQTVTSSSGLLLGTVAYLSPEQVERGIADARSDVYAAGLVFFEMLTGSKAFDGDTAINVAYQHVHAGAPRLRSRAPDAPEILDEVVAAATSLDPDGRPADAAAFAAMLRTARRELTPEELDDRPVDVAAVASTLTRTTALPVERHRTGATAASAPARGAPTRVGPSLRDQVRGAPPATPGVPVNSGRTRTAAPRPPRRAVWPWILVVVSAAIASATAWFFIAGPGAPTIVPTVVGKPVVAAESTLRAQHLDPNRQDEFSETVAKGLVIATDPQANAEVRRGTTVTLLVSQGPERYVVPTLGGVGLEDAKAQLADVNLVVGKVTETFSEDVEKGQVMATDPKAGTQLKKGTPVALTVSKGREPITVENFTGKPLADAKAALGKAGLVVEEAGPQENNDTIPEGSIIRQDPAGGTLFRGDKVSVVVSKGPVKVAVPSGLVGKQASEVEGILKAAGFTVKIVEGGIPGINFGTVGRVTPGEGTMVDKGSLVTLTTV
ncbi:Stk1 family PASTA domain-containing Ser/Thr kinase [Knoellia sp. Soil729]|uniref:Stk1 family PASTA domain-containing Ser/Thr kinase n=1 Tax=Knoellia sp. Soil729 TaxID=1736394 RepID=UPI0006FB8663|nr:Stk1 family PASTA domain-containing Ser/Thr kinase [Knoellia sp. Soil729]KRE40202.1 serine/threonine protein kinase [Knoellia sp. Soil729]